MYFTRHGAGSYHHCVRCMISFQNTVHGKKRWNRLWAATSKTQRPIQSLKEMAGRVSERGQRQRCGQKLGENMRLLLQQSSAERPSFLVELSGKDGSVLRDLYAVLTFEQLQILHL